MSGDDGLTTVLAIFWLASVVRFFGGVARHEVAGGEMSIAALMVLLVPWLLHGALRERRRSP